MTGSMAPGQHGGDAPRVARSLGVDPASLVDLSMSMNPFAPDVVPIVMSALAKDPGSVGHYPDSDDAERLLADAIGVAAERLVITNGGAEAIALVAALQPIGDVVEPEFSLYRRHLRSTAPGAPRWRSNPSNPLGVLSQPERERDVEPEREPTSAGSENVRACGWDVWDEAFHPLATGRWTSTALVE
ncbi:MAG: hypothetical protein WBV89_02110, partial [Ilumatobacter sp.]